MGLVKMGRTRDRSRTMMLLVIVVIVLVYLWMHDSGASATGQPPSESSKSHNRRFSMISMNTKETSYDHIAIANKFEYAEKHGYHMRYDFKGPRGFWDKFTDVEAAIRENKYDWIFWLDHDTLITNSSVKLEHIVDEALASVENPDNIDLIVTPDCFPLNTGAMLFRSTPWVFELFKHAWECGKLEMEPGRHFSEQDCLRDLIKDNIVHARDKSISIRQWKMNAFPEEIPCYDERDGRHWEKGMFVVHFAGAWAHVHDKGEDPTGYLMRRYLQWVE